MSDLVVSKTPDVMLALANEIAMGILPLRQILENNSVEPAAWAAIERNKRFQEILQSKIVEWNGALNTPERIKLKSATILEQNLPGFHKLLQDEAASAGAKIEVAKFLARITGLGNEARENVLAGANTGGGFTLRIFVGEKPLVIDGKAEPAPSDRAIEVD